LTVRRAGLTLRQVLFKREAVMSCTRHFMAFQWERHAWERRITHTECRTFRDTDKWGRRVPADYVTCHAQYVCRDCGAVREGEECGCDRARADACAVRLACLAEVRDQDQGVRA
jgi:hypothetical protein